MCRNMNSRVVRNSKIKEQDDKIDDLYTQVNKLIDTMNEKSANWDKTLNDFMDKHNTLVDRVKELDQKEFKGLVDMMNRVIDGHNALRDLIEIVDNRIDDLTEEEPESDNEELESEQEEDETEPEKPKPDNLFCLDLNIDQTKFGLPSCNLKTHLDRNGAQKLFDNLFEFLTKSN